MRKLLPPDADGLAAAGGPAELKQGGLAQLSPQCHQSLQRRAAEAEHNGVPLLLVNNSAARVSLEIVNDLRDESP